MSYLVHHGIKGQKWGVRHGPPYPLDKSDYSSLEKKAIWRASSAKRTEQSDFKKGLTDKQKKYIKIGAAAVGVTLLACGGIYLYKRTNPHYKYSEFIGSPLKDTLDKFSSSNGVRFKKGTVFQRITNSDNEEYIDRGSTYVSKYFSDNMKYKSRMPSESHNYGAEMYKYKLKSKTEIKAPSSRETAELFLKLNPDATHADFMNFINFDIREKGYDRNEFVKELKKLGFNAVIDENDYGWTKKPLILLDPSDSVSISKISKLRTVEKVIATIMQ